MNLWVKRTGQLLLVALFLMSCEDDSFLLGFRSQKKFNVGYQEFSIGDGSIIAIDSIATDNFFGASPARVLIGQYNDPILGSVRCEGYAMFYPSSKAKLASNTALGYVYDSITFQFKLDNYYYGLVGNGESFTIHRITGDTLSYKKPFTTTVDGEEKIVIGTKRYYAHSSVEYDPTPLGEITQYTRIFRENRTDMVREITNLDIDQLDEAKDTLVAAIRLPDAFGEELFSVALNDANSEFSNEIKFKTRFKGLAFIPTTSNSVLGFTIEPTFSNVTLHYHSTEAGAVKDTLSRTFNFTGVNVPSFHNIQINRTAGLPTPDQPYTGVDPGSGLRVVSNGNLMITKIDLNSFYTQFADTIEGDVIINSGQIVIESVDSEEGYRSIPNFEMRVMKENDRYVDYRINEDSASMRGYAAINDGRFYYAMSDPSMVNQGGNATNLAYNSSKAQYTGTATVFTQTLFDNRKKSAESRLRYLGLYPASSITGLSVSSIGKSINRTIFNKSNIKLRIYYTLPNKPNL